MTSSATDPLRRLRAATRRLGKIAAESERLAAERTDCVAALQSDGWSLAQIADAVGVSKAAVQKMAQR